MPDRYRPELAGALVNLGIFYARMDRAGDALLVTQEAVGVRRELAEVMPDRYRPGLASRSAKISAPGISRWAVSRTRCRLPMKRSASTVSWLMHCPGSAPASLTA